jgi:predicted nucleic acid-binding protein
MSAVFGDSFLYIALLNRHDQFHAKAVAFVDSFRDRVVTTEWVLAEVGDAFAGSKVRPHIKAFVNELKGNQSVEVIEASSTLFRRGLELYHARADKEWSLTDCTSFEVMEEFGLTEAVMGDRHYEQAGYRALLLQSI